MVGSPEPLPLHAEDELRECLKLYHVEIDRTRTNAVLDAMRRGQKIEAIKELRGSASPRIGLKESKEIIDSFGDRLKASRNDRFRR